MKIKSNWNIESSTVLNRDRPTESSRQSLHVKSKYMQAKRKFPNCEVIVAKTLKMWNGMTVVKRVGLVLGIYGTLVAMCNLFWAIFSYERHYGVHKNFITYLIFVNASDHVVQMSYIIISIVDVCAAALLYSGIMMVNMENEINLRAIPNKRVFLKHFTFLVLNI